MNMTHEELRRLYQDYWSRENRNSSSRCNFLEELIEYIIAGNQIKKNIKLFSHLEKCPSCARDFAFLQDVRKSENALIADIEALFEDELGSPELRANVRPRSHPFWPHWRKAIPVAQLLIFTALLFLLFKMFPQNLLMKDSLRANIQRTIHIPDSFNGALMKPHLLFTWDGNRSIKYYFLDIYDESLTLIWRSERLLENRCLIPEEAAKNWAFNKTYFWMVTGYEKAGDSWESALTKFILVNRK